MSTGALEDIINGMKPPIVLKEDKKLLVKLKAMKDEAKAAKAVHTPNWDSLPDYYKGKQWPGNMPSHRVPGVMNFVQQLVERKAALMTDAQPIIKVSHYLGDTADPELAKRVQDACDVLEAYIKSIWQEHNMLSRIARAIVYAEVFGGVAFNTGIDKARRKQGVDPAIFVLDPRCVYFDPYVYAADEMYRAYYQIVEDLRPTDQLRDEFPSVADKIKPSPFLAQTSTEYGLEELKSKIRKLFGFSVGRQVTAIDRTEVTEYWFLDYQRDPSGSRMYPDGRHIITAGDSVILVDEPNPYVDGQFPIDYMEWHLDLNSVWGFGDVDLYKSTQDMLNKLVSLVIENATLMTNSIWIGDADALSPDGWAKLTNVPGSHVKVRPGRMLRREPPTPLGAGTFEFLSFLMGGLERLSSITDITAGRRPGEVSSGVGIQSLMEASVTVIRYKARCLEELLTRVGQKLISRIFQYVNDARHFKVIGDMGKVLNYHFEKKKYLTDPGFEFKDFSFSIVPGSSLNVNRYQRGLQMLQLFQMGIIKDPRRVLKALDIPDVERVLEENEAIEAAALAQSMIKNQVGVPHDVPLEEKRGGRRDDQLPRVIQRSPETGN